MPIFWGAILNLILKSAVKAKGAASAVVKEGVIGAAGKAAGKAIGGQAGETLGAKVGSTLQGLSGAVGGGGSAASVPSQSVPFDVGSSPSPSDQSHGVSPFSELKPRMGIEHDVESQPGIGLADGLAKDQASGTETLEELMRRRLVARGRGF
jgi:hypothetical protein